MKQMRLMSAYQYVDQLIFTEKDGLKLRRDYEQTPLGGYHRLNSGQWRLRTKRRSGGHTWKPVEVRQLPKRLRVEALLLGLSL